MTDNIQPFFIVGAPRCGTTAMARYLGKHPNISFSRPKETHYFTFPRPTNTPDAMRQEFVSAYFTAISEKTLMIGEGSVSTLYSDDAIRRIMRSFNAPKFIVMLRDPVELTRSYHARLLHLRQEDEADLAKAWDLQGARAQGQCIPRNCQDPRILKYAEIARIGHYSAQLMNLAGRSNCMAILFDDVLSDTLSTYKATLDFLSIPYDGRTEFKRKNTTSSYKIGMLQSLYGSPLMRPVARQMFKSPVRAAQIQRALRKLRKKVKRFNTVEVTLPPIDPEFANQLRLGFAEDISILGRALGKDLSHWISPSQTGV